MKTVKDLDELPHRVDGNTISLWGSSWIIWRIQIFVRSKIDPHVLIDYHTGATFQREDGTNWEWPAYKRDRDIKMVDGERVPTPWSPLKGCPAYCDDRMYPPNRKQAAA